MIIPIILILLIISFSGCIEENNQNNSQTKGIITSSIKNLLLTIDDLPNGFKGLYQGNERQMTSEFSRYPEDKPVEYYVIGFSKGNSSNESGYEIITCELNRFSSIEDAKNAYSPTIEHIIDVGEFDVIDGSINVIGNESKGITKENYSDVLSFRILNVIGLIGSKDFTTTLELSEIVEERILDSIN
jgi:hypothetical protein